VVGDSGNHGAYGIVDPDTGATTETGILPLSDEASDDLEGAAARGDRLYAITSSGWIRVWQRRGKGFELVGKPYPLGPIDLPDGKHKNRALEGDGMVCNGRVINCGRNYEGLCLAPSPPSPSCIGFAAAKADGHLYCLTEDAGKLVVHHDRAIAITRPGALADCAFGDDGTLWAGSNLADFGEVYRVAHWDDPAAATVERVGVLAVGFPETIAARGDVVYRMSDMGGSPSLMARFRCRK
jgi:outer membrane protein assembly factor BamB